MLGRSRLSGVRKKHRRSEKNGYAANGFSHKALLLIYNARVVLTVAETKHYRQILFFVIEYKYNEYVPDRP